MTQFAQDGITPEEICALQHVGICAFEAVFRPEFDQMMKFTKTCPGCATLHVD
jgi:hypothetical protein